MGLRTLVKRFVNEKKGTSFTVTGGKRARSGWDHVFTSSFWQGVENIAAWGLLF